MKTGNSLNTQIIKAAKAIVLRKNTSTQQWEILLQKYLKSSNPEKLQDKYALPGGKLEEGDSFEDALRREVEEETGVLAILSKKVGEDFAFEYKKKDGSVVRIVASVFTAFVEDESQINTENTVELNSVLSAPNWVPILELRSDQLVHDEAPYVEIVIKNLSSFVELDLNSEIDNK